MLAKLVLVAWWTHYIYYAS